MLNTAPFLPSLIYPHAHRSPKHELAELKAASKAARDPFELVEKDVSTLSGGVKDLLGSDHPVLESCAK